MRVTTRAPRSALQDRRLAVTGFLLVLLLAMVHAIWPTPGLAATTSQAAAAPQAQMQAGAQAFASGDFAEALRQWSLAASGYEAAG